MRAPADHGVYDALDLLRRLALAENHLRRPLTGGAVVVYLGVAQILIGGLAQEPGGGLGGGPAGADVLQELQKFFFVHRLPLQLV